MCTYYVFTIYHHQLDQDQLMHILLVDASSTRSLALDSSSVLAAGVLNDGR